MAKRCLAYNHSYGRTRTQHGSSIISIVIYTEEAMKTIVSLVDLTEADSRILDLTLVFASALGSNVVLLHVMPSDATDDSAVEALGAATLQSIESPDVVREVNVASLNENLESLTGHGVAATALQFQGPVAETVLSKLKSLHADLVIMGSHHHSALYNLFIGSVTADILGKAPCPVLVVPYPSNSQVPGVSSV